MLHTGGDDINISEAHIQKVLDNAYKTFLNKLYPSKDKTTEKIKRKKKIAPLQDNTLAASIELSGTPVTTVHRSKISVYIETPFRTNFNQEFILCII